MCRALKGLDYPATDPWLTGSNPWEVRKSQIGTIVARCIVAALTDRIVTAARLDNTVTVKFYGNANRDASPTQRWTDGIEVLVGVHKHSSSLYCLHRLTL